MGMWKDWIVEMQSSLSCNVHVHSFEKLFSTCKFILPFEFIELFGV